MQEPVSNTGRRQALSNVTSPLPKYKGLVYAPVLIFLPGFIQYSPFIVTVHALPFLTIVNLADADEE